MEVSFQTVKKVRNRQNQSNFFGVMQSFAFFKIQSIPNFSTKIMLAFARILTYCATRVLPYLCTPTDASCLSSELLDSPSACRKGFFDTLKTGVTIAVTPVSYFLSR